MHTNKHCTHSYQPPNTTGILRVPPDAPPALRDATPHLRVFQCFSECLPFAHYPLPTTLYHYPCAFLMDSIRIPHCSCSAVPPTSYPTPYAVAGLRTLRPLTRVPDFSVVYNVSLYVVYCSLNINYDYRLQLSVFPCSFSPLFSCLLKSSYFNLVPRVSPPSPATSDPSGTYGPPPIPPGSLRRSSGLRNYC